MRMASIHESGKRFVRKRTSFCHHHVKIRSSTPSDPCRPAISRSSKLYRSILAGVMLAAACNEFLSEVSSGVGGCKAVYGRPHKERPTGCIMTGGPSCLGS